MMQSDEFFTKQRIIPTSGINNFVLSNTTQNLKTASLHVYGP